MPEETRRDEKDERGDRPAGVELPVCPNCMTPANPCDRFCRECGCPLSPLTGFDPMGRIYSQGFVYRKAATKRVSKMTVLLLWLLLAPGPAMYLLVMLRDVVSDLGEGRLTAGRLLLGLLWLAGITVLPGLLLYRVTANYLRQGDGREEGDEPDELDEEARE